MLSSTDLKYKSLNPKHKFDEVPLEWNEHHLHLVLSQRRNYAFNQNNKYELDYSWAMHVPLIRTE